MENVLSPVLLALTVVGEIMVKENSSSAQLCTGKKCKDGRKRFFELIKFRTMNNAYGEMSAVSFWAR